LHKWLLQDQSAHDQRGHDPKIQRIMDMRREFRVHAIGYTHGTGKLIIIFQKKVDSTHHLIGHGWVKGIFALKDGGAMG
jgi:hypothetical protein